MNNSQLRRRDLLNMINEVSFSTVDTQLYLDTHPCDENALSYFHECSKIRNQSLKEYAKLYGPLTIDTASAASVDRWTWINDPWPWQEGGC